MATNDRSALQVRHIPGNVDCPVELTPVVRKKWDELHYLEMTPRQIAAFQATPRPLPGSVSFGWGVAIIGVMVVAWRVLAHLGYFV